MPSQEVARLKTRARAKVASPLTPRRTGNRTLPGPKREELDFQMGLKAPLPIILSGMTHQAHAFALHNTCLCTHTLTVFGPSASRPYDDRTVCVYGRYSCTPPAFAYRTRESYRSLTPIRALVPMQHRISAHTKTNGPWV